MGLDVGAFDGTFDASAIGDTDGMIVGNTDDASEGETLGATRWRTRWRLGGRTGWRVALRTCWRTDCAEVGELYDTNGWPQLVTVSYDGLCATDTR